jgi:Mg-chelatase subunit ChlD
MAYDLATTTAAAEIVKTQLNRSLEKKSLSDLVRARKQRSLLLVDVSGSMNDRIRAGGRKIDALREVVKTLRETHPVPVAAFGLDSFANNGTTVLMVDVVPEPQSQTPLHTAIAFGKDKGATHLVVVTDGFPDSESLAFEAAARFGGTIDVFYIGDGGDSGAQFTKELARRTGGTANVTDLGDDASQKQLTSAIAGLLPESC